MRVSVPGNILLCGEYFITEENGLGVACAIDSRITLCCGSASSDRLLIEGRMGPQSIRWSPDAPESSVLIESVVQTLSDFFAQSVSDWDGFPAADIEMDTSAFYDSGGQKKGYGSSAAATAGLCAMLLHLVLGARPEPDLVFRLALSAHRRFQKGRGSGYDVAASVYGGLGLFEGGRVPRYLRRPGDRWPNGDDKRPGEQRLTTYSRRPADVQHLQCDQWKPSPPFYVYLVQGLKAVTTADALLAYERFRAESRQEWRERFDASNGIAMAMWGADGFGELSSCVSGARDLGLELGELIGVSAGFEPRDAADRAVLEMGLWKAIGAGNELAAVLLEEEMPGCLRIAEQGLIWL